MRESNCLMAFLTKSCSIESHRRLFPPLPAVLLSSSEAEALRQRQREWELEEGKGRSDGLLRGKGIEECFFWFGKLSFEAVGADMEAIIITKKKSFVCCSLLCFGFSLRVKTQWICECEYFVIFFPSFL